MDEPKNPQPSRRERQSIARREQILHAAAYLFAERGYHRTTTKDIAAAADVAEGTIYNFFETKNDLLFAILAHLSESEIPQAGLVPGVAGLTQVSSVDARQYFASLLALRREYFAESSVILQAILSEILANSELRQRYAKEMLQPTLEGLEKDLALRMQLGQICDLDTPAVARVLTSIWIGLFVLQVLEDPHQQPEWERVAEATLQMMFEGISPSKSLSK